MGSYLVITMMVEAHDDVLHTMGRVLWIICEHNNNMFTS